MYSEEKVLVINSKKINFKKFNSVDGSQQDNFLILHGWGGKSDSWVDVAELLAKSNFNVYIPDLPGHGKTDLTRIFTLDEYGDFVVRFCEEIGLRNFSIIAHSNGGRIFLNLLNKKIFHQDKNISDKFLEVPKEKNTFIKNFLEKNSHLAKNLQKKFFLEKIFLIGSAGIRPKLNFKQKFIQACSKYFPVFKKISFLRVLVLKLIGGQDYLTASNNYHLKATFLNVLNTDLLDILPKIKEKIFLIWGDQDSYTPLWMGNKMNELLENSELDILKGERHGIHLHSPKKLSEIILSKFNIK